MKIGREADLLDALPKWVIRGVVQILAVGVAVDHCSTETEVSRTPLEFSSSSSVGILHRKVGKAGVALRALLDFDR
jgi:hypothetical protein